MSLHIRLYTNFWTHRKTARLRSILGNDALWIPPRLWSYAAENQPDGDFSNYSPEELALLIGYSSNAQAMLQALQQACFLDGMKINGWEEHNAYHHAFSERAKKAADARWKGKDKKGKEKKRDKHCLEHAWSIDDLISCIPTTLNTERFKNEWKSWIEVRCKIKKVKDPLMFKEQLKQLEEWGEPKAFASIKKSIMNGWQGIFEPKENEVDKTKKNDPKPGFQS